MADPVSELPIESANPQGAVTEPMPEEKTQGGKPPKVFEELPDSVADLQVVQWISMGKPPAARVGPGEFYPELEPLEENLVEVIDAGLGVFQAQSGDTVLYNPLFVKEEELQTADAEGKLDLVAPTYGELTGKSPQEIDDKTAKRLDKHAKNNMQKLSAGASTSDRAAKPAQPSTPVSKLPPGAQEKLVGAQTNKSNLNSPTSGPRPGGGRILNSILAQ